MILIIASTHAQAEDCARLNGLAPSAWCYVNEVRTLYCVGVSVVWAWGDYWRRRDFAQLDQVIRRRGMRYGTPPVIA